MEFEDKIYKKSNLEFNDSISTYNGWGAQQNPFAFEAFFNFLKEVRPKTIFEVGTSLGGFTQYLNYTCNILGIDTSIVTFDILSRDGYKELRKNGIEVVLENIFHENYTTIPEKYIEIIRQEGTTVVLCDGGDKAREFKLLSQYLKPGDFILGHDYAKDQDDFNNRVNGKLWNWFELQESDISEVCKQYSLEPFMQETFNLAVWACRRKV